MKYKQYSPEIWQQFETATARAIARDKTPIAAFDADGTLWDTDLGEGFFRFKIANRLVELPPKPWQHYEELKKQNGDPRGAYLWLAQILSGQSLGQAREWAQAAVAANSPTPIFPEQQRLITWLKNKGVRVLIVTASVRWAVEPGALLLGLTHDDVIGIETEVKDDRLTADAKGIITHKEGKAQALLAATGGQKPFLCAGNTMGDLELLECSSDLRLAISATKPDDRLFPTESELQAVARDRGWIAQRFTE